MHIIHSDLLRLVSWMHLSFLVFDLEDGFRAHDDVHLVNDRLSMVAAAVWSDCNWL